jgi:hypothetical protein
VKENVGGSNSAASGITTRGYEPNAGGDARYRGRKQNAIREREECTHPGVDSRACYCVDFDMACARSNRVSRHRIDGADFLPAGEVRCIQSLAGILDARVVRTSC